MTKRRISLAVLATALVWMIAPAIASANAGIHGGYATDTDACAGCHRAHTAVSSITWSNGAYSGSALLMAETTEVYQFCYTCHDSTGQGAETNVQDGIYEGTAYGSQDATLNGGGFDNVAGMAVTSTHMYNGASWGAYGGGTDGSSVTSVGTGPLIKMDCSSCHDVHGSSNYRILSDQVNSVAVGGYDGGIASADPTPTPFVLSNETGYPKTNNGYTYDGFKLHTAYPGYVPDYTTPKYAKGRTTDKGMTGWCVGCHTQYATKTGSYNAGDGFNLTTRHRHGVNVEVGGFNGVRPINLATTVPLAHSLNETATATIGGTQTNQGTDWIDCMACHVAHGTATQMTGFANVASSLDLVPDSGTGGVEPTGDSALLRANNRTACESCHNK